MSDRIWLGHLGSLALAALLAVLVWLASSENDRPMRNVSSYPVPPAEGIPIALPELPAGWSAYDLTPRSVRVGLRGLDEGVAGLTPSSFTAKADVEALPPREDIYSVPVRVECPSCSRRGVRMTSVQPETLSLRVARTVTRTHTVQTETADALPSGYRLVASALEPEAVTVLGAEAAVSRVDRVVARLASLEAAGEPQSLRGVPLVALDVAGREVPGVRIDPAVADVSAALERRGLPVAVYPDLTGMDDVADGYVMGGFTTEPDIAELIGPPELLADIRSQGRVSTAPVDVTGASGRLEKRVALLLPEGVTALNAREGITVTVDVEPLPGSATLDVPVEPRGLGEGLEATITPARVRVLLSGPRPDLERIQPSDVAVYADVSGRAAGTYRLRVRLEAPTGVRARSMTPEQVEVVVRSTGAPSGP